MNREFADGRGRCGWVPANDGLYIAYHDHEWGIPCFDDRKLFAMLCLEGAQAGLSWITILRRRQSYYAAFDDFDPKKMADYDDHKVANLLRNEGIIRNRLKVVAFISNAQAYLAMLESGQTLSDFAWSYVENEPIIRPETDRSMAIAEQVSKDLKKAGWRFVGPTICYSFMQACGMVNDHEEHCWLGHPK